jgi:NAD(P)-dependent dehydrogenase (short-subunit alcohol dehydrogenase family)
MKMGLDRLKGKTALVTGSTYGIGEATARVFAREGAHVVVTGRSKSQGEEVVRGIKGDGGSAEYAHLDVTDEEEVARLMHSIHDRRGRLDILVNNAGISGPNKPLEDYTRKEWDSVFEVNVTGSFLCTKHAVPLMKESGGGVIVYISSIYGIVGAGDVPAYHATKAADRMMAKNDALSYAKYGIRANSVHPGFIWTPMVRDFVEKTSKETSIDKDIIVAELGKKHPLGHIGEPEDVAYGVLFLCSDEAKFITGTELVIDGGYTTQ